jgi:uncharacterized protein YuzE
LGSKGLGLSIGKTKSEGLINNLLEVNRAGKMTGIRFWEDSDKKCITSEFQFVRLV